MGLARHLVERLCVAALVTAALLPGMSPATARLGARVGGTASISSLNWAGYAAHRAGAQFTDVRGSWTQPVVRCPQGGTYSSFWLGLDGYPSDHVEQVGTGADCVQATMPSYYAWYELYPGPRVRMPMVIRPGDRIEAEVGHGGGGTSLRLRNLSAGRAFATTHQGPTGPLASAEWVAEAPSACSGAGCTVLPLADFGTVAFSGCSADGAPGSSGTITSTAWSSDALTMVTRSGVVIAQPSDVTADGASFSVSVR